MLSYVDCSILQYIDYTCISFALWGLMITCFFPYRSCKISIATQMLFKIGVPINFTNFTGKRLCWSPFFLKKTPTQEFSREICEIFKNTFICRTPSVDAFRYSFSGVASQLSSQIIELVSFAQWISFVNCDFIWIPKLS